MGSGPPPEPAAPPAARQALWGLPLAAALLPLVATAAAYAMSVRIGAVPDCNPFVDGCVSISRAARHGLPNIVFRAAVLPAAVLQAACWWLCVAWLRSLPGALVPSGRGVALLPMLGAVAGVALVLYASFLGTEGDGYRLLRRYGTTVYFGFTCLCMLIVAGQVQRRLRGSPRQRVAGHLLVALCAALPLLGLAHVLLPLALPGEAGREAVQNITEWWGGAIFTVFFLALARAWWVTGFRARLDAGGSQ